MIRFFDLLISFLGILLFSPILVIVSLLIIIDSKLPVFFTQNRVGRYNRDFKVFKFRTMFVDEENNSFLTLNKSGNKVTRIGNFLRKSKIDELPQLVNVLKGDMSLVGPRPELRKFVNMYNDEQREILMMKPGMTDYASIKFFNEDKLLTASDNPEDLYIKKILPEKIILNRLYFRNYSVKEYFKIIFITLYYILRQGRGK
jgi:lipopolysaccharide/colanic/teichoic acid biosynthesis glycosyltransferase